MADAFELARQAQQNAAGASQNTNEKPKELFEILEKALDSALKMFSKVVGAGNLNSIVGTGVLANLDFQKAALQSDKKVPILKDVSSNVADFVIEGTKFTSVTDFSKLSKPEISAEGISLASNGVSYAGAYGESGLGSYSPDMTPSRGASVEMSV